MQAGAAVRSVTKGWTWVDDGFVGLAKRHNPLLEQLIPEGRLRLGFSAGKLDCVDIRSAAFVGAALARNRSICLVLPDTQSRRSTFLFAYALLCHWWRGRELDVPLRRPALYCGVETGIREQLSQVAVAGMFGSLASAFSQTHLARSATVTAATNANVVENDLPPVVTAFSPADPRGLLHRFRPVWIALDLGDSSSLPWLHDLLDEARAQGIPVLAWSTNPLSEAVREFAQMGSIVKWPFGRSFNGCLVFGREESAEVLFQPYLITNVHPLLPAGRQLAPHDAALVETAQILARLTGVARGTVLYSAVQQHWRLLRAIENLSVPYDLYEAEAPKFWGLAPIQRLRETCNQLRSSIDAKHNPDAYALENAAEGLDEALAVVRDCEPPLWLALTELLHQDAPTEHARACVFLSRARRDLFSLALLARLNVVEEDLRPLGNWLMTMEDLAAYEVAGDLSDTEQVIPRALTILPTLVGLPSVQQLSRLCPLFLAEDSSILIHGYQKTLLERRIGQLNADLSPNIKAVSEVIADLVPLPQLETSLVLPARAVTGPHVSIDIDQGDYKPAKAPTMEALWPAGDEADEIGRIFDAEEDRAGDVSSAENEEQATDLAAYVDSAVEIKFSGGWRGLFEARERLNYVHQSAIEPRYVRSLRVRDQVLIIPFQRKQTLYSLVISRVHQHKNMQVPLALLRRWHDELRTGFARWRVRVGGSLLADSHTAALLLEKMQSLGSRLTSALAIQFWVRGVTLAPDDKEDLRRVAEVLNLTFTSAHYLKIAAAASRIRGLHRGLSNRLGHWLQDQAQGRGESHDHVVLDKDLGLTFGDIRASFVIAEVSIIREVRGPFLRSALGVVEKGN